MQNTDYWMNKQYRVSGTACDPDNCLHYFCQDTGGNLKCCRCGSILLVTPMLHFDYRTGIVKYCPDAKQAEGKYPLTYSINWGISGK